MCITITVARTVAPEAFERVEALSNELPETDVNFEGLVLKVLRHTTTAVQDPEDELRGSHLLHLVECVIDVEPGG